MSINLFTELLFTSNGTPGYFVRSVTSDLGQGTYEQAVFGAVQHVDLRHMKVCDELRFDVAATSSSSLSFGFSINNGRTYDYEQAFNISASSAASQIVAYPKIAGNTFTPRISSINGNWQLRRWYGRFSSNGEAR